MSTTSSHYSYYAQLAGGPGSSATVQSSHSVTGTTNSVTSSTPTFNTTSFITWNLITAPVTYSGYTGPDGGPIIKYSSTYYLLTDNSYSASSSVPTSATPTYTACYAAGTRILTAQGELPVESLVAGDLVPTLVGRRMAAIKWIGRSHVRCTRHPRPWDVNPIRIAAGAFGPGLPLRELVLSPDHSVFVDNVLVPVRYLVNGATIRQEAVEEITYFHVELDRHDVIFAEGLPAESYLDTGNRGAFANAGTPERHADFRAADRAVWASKACAELVESGPALAAIRDRLAAHAIALGMPIAPAHRIEIPGTGRIETLIPAGVGRIALVSPCRVPEGESRRLGACIGAIVVDDRNLPLDAPGLVSGFHLLETADDDAWRWTDGEALLELPPSYRETRLALDIRVRMGPEARAA